MSRHAVFKLAVIIAFLCFAVSWVARAHQAPSGWEYDASCCSQQDCAPAPDGAVREVAGGWRVTLRAGENPRVKSGEVSFFVPYGDRRIKPSGDGHFHPCLFPDVINETAQQGLTLLCLYVPPGGV